MDVFGLSISRSSPLPLRAQEFAEDNADIPIGILKFLARLRGLYRFWWFTHYATGLTGVIAGALLTALTASPSSGNPVPAVDSLTPLREWAWLIGIVAAVATSLVTFLGPLHKAERYWSAYHILEQACLEYRGNDGNPKLGKLMKRVMQVRRILQVADVDEKITGEAKENLSDITA